MNAALGQYDALFIIPLLQANYIFLAIVAGGVYFEEFATFGADDVYNQKDAEGFIKLNALRLRIAANKGRSQF